jgi:hypothetical protein
MRPGEKLEEALWEEGSTTEPTAHADVLRVIEPAGTGAPLAPALLHMLSAAVDDGDPLVIQAILADSLPSFAPFVRS